MDSSRATGRRTLAVPLGGETRGRKERVNIAVTVRLRVKNVGLPVQHGHVSVVVHERRDLRGGGGVVVNTTQ